MANSPNGVGQCSLLGRTNEFLPGDHATVNKLTLPLWVVKDERYVDDTLSTFPKQHQHILACGRGFSVLGRFFCAW